MLKDRKIMSNNIKMEKINCVYCSKPLEQNDNTVLYQFHTKCYNEVNEYSKVSSERIKEIISYNEVIKDLVLNSERAKWIIPVLVQFFEIYQPLFTSARTTQEIKEFDVFCAGFNILQSFGYLNSFHNVSNQYGAKDMKLDGFIGKLETYLNYLKSYAEKYNFE
jgi:hypothetical protein